MCAREEKKETRRKIDTNIGTDRRRERKGMAKGAEGRAKRRRTVAALHPRQHDFTSIDSRFSVCFVPLHSDN